MVSKVLYLKWKRYVDHHHLILEDGEDSQEVILEMLLGVNLQVNGGSLKRNKSFQIKLICILNDSTTK